jgi:two-component system response regulator MprA
MPSYDCDSVHVLVVEDDVNSARMMARMLREDGYEVEIATDGAAAIARLAREPAPDVLVTDIALPFADGLAIASYARVQRPGMTIYLVTGRPEMARGQRPLVPAPRVFTKPLDYASLRDDLEATTGVRSPRSSRRPDRRKDKSRA